MPLLPNVMMSCEPATGQPVTCAFGTGVAGMRQNQPSRDQPAFVEAALERTGRRVVVCTGHDHELVCAVDALVRVRTQPAG